MLPERTIPLQSGATLTLRPATPQDAEQITAHFRQVGGESENLPFSADEYHTTVEQQIESIESTNRDGGLYLIAAIAGKLAGVLTFTPGRRNRNRHVGDFGLTVEKEFWGLGIGTALLQDLLDWAVQSGHIRKINLRVRADNHSAIALYQKLGFREEGRQTRSMFVNGQFFDAYLMGIEIDPPKNVS